MIINSRKAKTIVILPQNTVFKYSSTGSMYTIQMKNVLDDLVNIICNSLLGLDFVRPFLFYEKTTTHMRDEKIIASFYFSNIYEPISKSYKSEKPTTIRVEDKILTTLDLTYETATMMEFFNVAGILNNKHDPPDWFDSI